MTQPDIIQQTQNITLTHCPICGSDAIYPFIEISSAPVYCNNLWFERDQALSAPKGSICLAFCLLCGHIYNQAFQPELMRYSAVYENSLHFSPRFNEYASWLADYMISRYELHAKEIVEIGSGKGEFLAMLCERGDNHGVGFDPSYDPNTTQIPTGVRLDFIPEAFSPRYAGIPMDFIYSRHTLEHIPNPADFTAMLNQTVSAGSKPPVFFEVPHTAFLVNRLSIWDIIYEHFSYFSPSSLQTLFRESGFQHCRLMDTYEGQFLCIEAVPGELAGRQAQLDPETRPYTLRELIDFKERYQQKVDLWKERFDTFSRQGKKAVVWGAGSKGVTFLNIIRPNGEVPCVVDLNPRKTGKFVVGTGHEIIQPAGLVELQPDVIIVMNPIYREEIAQIAGSLGLSAELVVA